MSVSYRNGVGIRFLLGPSDKQGDYTGLSRVPWAVIEVTDGQAGASDGYHEELPMADSRSKGLTAPVGRYCVGGARLPQATVTASLAADARTITK